MNAQNIARAHALIVEANSILERELNAVPVPPIITPPVIAPPSAAVIYGRDNYTDDADPRSANTRQHLVSDGKVLAVHLQVHTQPDRPYKATAVRLIDENNAGGNHVARIAQVGSAEMVGLFLGYGGGLTFDSFIRHAPRQEIVIDGAFDPPNLGPLAIALIDSSGRIISDVVASLGLPGRHHVCYEIVFERR